MDVKISVFSKTGESKNQLTVEMKQVAVKNAPAIIGSTIEAWHKATTELTLTAMNPLEFSQFLQESDGFLQPIPAKIGEKGEAESLSVQTKDLLKAIKETENVGSSYPDLVIETAEEETAADALVTGVKCAMADLSSVKRAKIPPKVHVPKVLTEKVITQRPVHELRSIVAHTPWLHIVRYSKWPAQKLRKAMLIGIAEYQKLMEKGETNIQITIKEEDVKA